MTHLSFSPRLRRTVQLVSVLVLLSGVASHVGHLPFAWAALFVSWAAVVTGRLAAILSTRSNQPEDDQ